MEQHDKRQRERDQSKRWWKGNTSDKQCAPPPRRGDRCPVCAEGELDYDSLFVLTCPRCGYVASSGAFT